MTAKVAKARADTVQEYKDSFKDTMDYLFLMRDAVNEYKASIKRVDPTIDVDYDNCLISGEPATPTSEESDEAPMEEPSRRSPSLLSQNMRMLSPRRQFSPQSNKLKLQPPLQPKTFCFYLFFI